MVLSLLRLHLAVCAASAALAPIGRGRRGKSWNQRAGGEGRSKGTNAKSQERSWRGRDEDSQTSQTERARSGEVRVGFRFGFVFSSCNRIERKRWKTRDWR